MLFRRTKAVFPLSPLAWASSLLLHVGFLVAVTLASGPPAATSTKGGLLTDRPLVVSLLHVPASGAAAVRVEGVGEANPQTELGEGRLEESSRREAPSERRPDHGAPLIATTGKHYYPTRDLDQRPYPVFPVHIPFPDVPLVKPKVTATLLLYIGEDGRVDRISVEDTELPGELEAAAREAFGSARMHAGMKDGVRVGSLMKVQVEFEAK